MRWRMILEEFGPEIIHIKGENNSAADALSRLPKVDVEVEPKTQAQNNEIFAQEIGTEATAYPLEYACIAEEQNRELQKKT